MSVFICRMLKIWLEEGCILSASELFEDTINGMELPCRIQYEATLKKEIIDLELVV